MVDGLFATHCAKVSATKEMFHIVSLLQPVLQQLHAAKLRCPSYFVMLAQHTHSWLYELMDLPLQVLIDAVVHAVNEDYDEMAGDFIKLGFLAPGTDITPIVPALEKIWRDSRGQSLADFNFRTVTSKFNELVYQYPIRIPERYSLVIRSLLTQEGICMTLKPEFHFLEVAYPYIAR